MIKKLFWAILALGGIGSLFLPDKSFSSYENRTLQTRPAFSSKSLFEGTYTKNWDSYLSDQFIGRNQWIALKTGTDQYIWQKKCINNIYLGKDNYLIPRYTVNDMEESLVEKNFLYAKDFQEKYQAKVILIPTASEILTDKLPSFPNHINQSSYLTNAIAKYDIDIIDASTILLQHANENIYYRTDHHWTLLGAYYLYETLVDAPIPYDTMIASNNFYGSSYRKINLPIPPDKLLQIKSTDSYNVIYDLTKEANTLYEDSVLTSMDQYRYYLDGNHATTHIYNKNGKNLIEKPLLIIKDSFANSFATLIANNYKEVHLIDLRYYNGSLEQYIIDHKIEEVMLLYNNINFMQDKHLYKLLK